MNTFHPRQSDCGRRVHKKANASALNFTSQIPSSICTVMFTRHLKPDSTIFKSWCSRTVVCYRFDRVDALLLNFVRLLQLANSSPKICGVPRDGRATFANHPARLPANCLAHLREISRQWPGSAYAMPPNVRASDSQDNSQYGVQRSRNARDAVCAKAIETSGESTRQTTRLGRACVRGLDESVTRGDRRQRELVFGFLLPPLVRPRAQTARSRFMA